MNIIGYDLATQSDDGDAGHGRINSIFILHKGNENDPKKAGLKQDPKIIK